MTEKEWEEESNKKTMIRRPLLRGLESKRRKSGKKNQYNRFGLRHTNYEPRYFMTLGNFCLQLERKVGVGSIMFRNNQQRPEWSPLGGH